MSTFISPAELARRAQERARKSSKEEIILQAMTIYSQSCCIETLNDTIYHDRMDKSDLEAEVEVLQKAVIKLQKVIRRYEEVPF